MVYEFIFLGFAPLDRSVLEKKPMAKRLRVKKKKRIRDLAAQAKQGIALYDSKSSAYLSKKAMFKKNNRSTWVEKTYTRLWCLGSRRGGVRGLGLGYWIGEGLP